MVFRPCPTARSRSNCEQHPDAEIVHSQPGLGLILGARVLSEFDDNPTLLTDAAPAAAPTRKLSRSPAPRDPDKAGLGQPRPRTPVNELICYRHALAMTSGSARSGRPPEASRYPKRILRLNLTYSASVPLTVSFLVLVPRNSAARSIRSSSRSMRAYPQAVVAFDLGESVGKDTPPCALC